MKTFRNSFIITVLMVLALMWGFIGGMFFEDYRHLLPITANPPELSLLDEAYLILIENGLDDPPIDPALEYGMIRGMLQAYGDPYSSFSEPAEAELNSHRLQGTFGGIGARMGTDLEGNIILYPYPDGPAAASGVIDGDRLLQVDNMVIAPNNSMDPILSAVRGPVGQSVTLTVASPPNYEPRQVIIQRAEIELPSVTWHLDSEMMRMGVIEINIIAESTPTEILRAVTDLQERGATHFVLDLRNNGGGLLNAGVNTARLFLEQGEVMRQQYRERSEEVFRVERRGQLSDLPLVVLINGNTASAAEIIAGALQMNERAVLIGRPTYGKNTIQLVFTLKDGSNLNITAAEWWFSELDFPNGEYGLLPDIDVPDTDENPRSAMQASIEHFFGTED